MLFWWICGGESVLPVLLLRHLGSSPPCLTLWNSMDCSPPGLTVHGISQARTLEWVAISSSRGTSWLWSRTWVSCLAGGVPYHWPIWEAPDLRYKRKFIYCVCMGKTVNLEKEILASLIVNKWVDISIPGNKLIKAVHAGLLFLFKKKPWVPLGVAKQVLVAQSYLTLWGPVDCKHQASLSIEFSRKNTGVGCHSLLEGIFHT